MEFDRGFAFAPDVAEYGEGEDAGFGPVGYSDVSGHHGVAGFEASRENDVGDSGCVDVIALAFFGCFIDVQRGFGAIGDIGVRIAIFL